LTVENEDWQLKTGIENLKIQNKPYRAKCKDSQSINHQSKIINQKSKIPEVKTVPCKV
jgi:hypothetical protein